MHGSRSFLATTVILCLCLCVILCLLLVPFGTYVCSVDPATLFVPCCLSVSSCCSEYADFRVSSDGELQGVGLLIANEPVNKHLLVLSAIKGGPADRAGITSGNSGRLNGEGV